MYIGVCSLSVRGELIALPALEGQDSAREYSTRFIILYYL
jgi:hypothetical protein